MIVAHAMITHRKTKRNTKRRRGAAVIETILVMMPLLLLTVGVIDLGVAVFRYHVLAEAARHGARSAIVRGKLATQLVPWGPSSVTAMASASGTPVVDKVQPMLIGCDLDQTEVTIEWPSGSNAVGKQVRVTISSPYSPALSFIGTGDITLSASSTMRIAH